MLPQSAPEIPAAAKNREVVVGLDFSRDLIRAIHHAGVCVYLQDAGLRIAWAQNVPPSWQPGCAPGARDADFLPADDARRLTEAKLRVLEGGRQESCEITTPDEQGPRWFDVWIDPAEKGVLTTVVETTEHRHREQTLKSLLREVSHRSKNLLAIIQSIATQTGRYSGSIDTFLARFRGRLQSLAASQDLVTLSNWRGADLKELIANQVGRYATDPRASIRLEGINPYLNPNAALHVGLALHELAVNSMSYGALSQPGGFVIIAARAGTDADGQKTLTISWGETTRPTKEHVEKRFGSVALERVVPASLRGTASLDIGNDRLDYTLVVPAGIAGHE